jgi:hypothetical protein
VERPDGELAVSRPLLALVAWLAVLPMAARAAQKDPPPADPSELLETFLSGIGVFREVTAAQLQQEVATLGGVPFRRDVPLAFMTRAELARYLHDFFDDEYPEQKARADQRTLVGFDLLAPAVDLRKLRWRLLEENVAGFYDERPGRKQLYAVSPQKRLTPANQMILSHELRHALQDQYVNVHGMLPASISDFDDRRLAFLSLLEGDANFVMERFLFQRLGVERPEGPDQPATGLVGPLLSEAPPVLRDQLLMPYLVGRPLAAAVWRQGGGNALREAWRRPPDTTEQVLHPEKFFRREAAAPIALDYEPTGGQVISEGVLGELLTRTLLGAGGEEAAAGWGGDRYRVWDLSGRTLLVWRSVWDTATDKQEFVAMLRKSFAGRRGNGAHRRGFLAFSGEAGWVYAWGEQADAVLLVASDSSDAMETALRSLEPSLALTSTGGGRDNPRARTTQESP